MDICRNFNFKNSYLKDINTGNFISIYSNNTVASDVERDELPASDGDSIITLHDMNINVYDEDSNSWKKLFGNRGFGSDPYSPRATGIFAISNTCYSINIESCHIEQFSGMFIDDKTWSGGCSNGINSRGVFGGSNSTINSMEYMSISTCNTTYDFGDLSFNQIAGAALSNGINNRGVFTGGTTSLNSMCYITISSTGNALNFGQLTYENRHHTCLSNATGNRGLIIGTQQIVWTSNTIDYRFVPSNLSASGCTKIDLISITTPSNSLLFANLIYPSTFHGSCSNNEYNRCIKVGGSTWGELRQFGHYTSVWYWYINSDQYAILSNMEYFSMITISNASSFGNLLNNQGTVACISNGIRNRGISYGDNGTITFGSIFNFLHIGGTAEMNSGLINTRYTNRFTSISNA